MRYPSGVGRRPRHEERRRVSLPTGHPAPDRRRGPGGRRRAPGLPALDRGAVRDDPILSEPVLRGRRVFLRPPAAHDRDAFLALNRASVRAHRGLAHPATTPGRYDEFLAKSKRPDEASFLIFRAEDDAVLGSIRLSVIVRGAFQSAFLGYMIGAPYLRRGYMTEALQLLLGYAFRELKLHRVEANILPGNDASLALVRRAGFQREGFSRRYLKIGGRWRDHERWALLREEWRPARR